MRGGMPQAIGRGMVRGVGHVHALAHASRRDSAGHGMRAKGHRKPRKHGKQEQAAVAKAKHAPTIARGRSGYNCPMNYRHAYHAGNFADLLKHTVLLALLEALKAKDKPFSYIDTHAGSGRYDLKSMQAQKTGEAELGIGKLAVASGLPPLLWDLLGHVRAVNEGEAIRYYPGSPLLAQRVLRAGDSAQLCELHAEEAEALRSVLHNDPRMHVHKRDGYEAMGGLLPPPEKRGLVLIDPPFERADEFRAVETALRLALQRWPTGMYAVWYPVKVRSTVQPFLRWASRAARRVLCAEIMLHADNTPLRLNGTGMLVLNAPWQLDTALAESMEVLARTLGGQSHLTWLAQDNDA
jgi:23S rRNA (adenine2030-N6)-methyltransferase